MAGTTKRPNILLITSDQQHFGTIGALNPKIKTPSLDQLCNEGVRFDRAYCPNPTCTPTRASIITGMYPSQHGAWTLGTKLFEDVPVVGDQLRGAGYFTSLVGKAHFQQLLNRKGMESLESQPLMRDLEFWRNFHGPWYGFEHIETARMHTWESHAGQHYAIWMEEKGLKNWRDYFGAWPANKEDSIRHIKMQHWDLPEQYHYNVWTAERTIAQMERAKEEGRPFFVWSSFFDPHPPYCVPEPWASMYRPEDMEPGKLTPGELDKMPTHFRMTQGQHDEYWVKIKEQAGITIHGQGRHDRFTERQLQEFMAIYYGMVSFMDHEIGKIMAALDRLGMADDTIVIFSTDHGHYMGQHGLVFKCLYHYEDMIKIPFIVRWPGKAPAGTVSNNIQNLVDLAPSFVAAAGLPIPGVMTGVNQLQTWCGGEAARSWSITENHHTPKNFNIRTYVNQRYKITIYQANNEGEIFDLQEDPGELNNLWDSPSAQELKTRLLHEFMQATMSCEPMRMPRITGA